MNKFTNTPNTSPQPEPEQRDGDHGAPLAPLSNYTLAENCPNCDAPVVRRACKVRCERCGFVWDCSEL